MPTSQHRMITQITQQSVPEEIGGPVHTALADRLRITSAEARRRVRDADQLGEPISLTGEPLAVLQATARGRR